MSKIKVSGDRLVFLRAWWGNIFCPSLLAYSSSKHSLAYRCIILILHLYMMLSLGLCLHMIVIFYRPQLHWIRVPLYFNMTSSQLIISAITLFPSKSHSKVLEFRSSTVFEAQNPIHKADY